MVVSFSSFYQINIYVSISANTCIVKTTLHSNTIVNEAFSDLVILSTWTTRYLGYHSMENVILTRDMTVLLLRLVVVWLGYIFYKTLMFKSHIVTFLKLFSQHHWWCHKWTITRIYGMTDTLCVTAKIFQKNHWEKGS